MLFSLLRIRDSQARPSGVRNETSGAKISLVSPFLKGLTRLENNQSLRGQSAHVVARSIGAATHKCVMARQMGFLCELARWRLARHVPALVTRGARPVRNHVSLYLTASLRRSLPSVIHAAANMEGCASSRAARNTCKVAFTSSSPRCVGASAPIIFASPANL